MQPADSSAAPASTVWLRIPMFRPRVTFILLSVLIAVFIIEIIQGSSLDAAGDAQVLLDLGAKSNARIIQGEYWRLITAMFLHAGLLHIAFNGYALLIFGQQIESFYGAARFLAIYFVGGLAGGIASFAFSPALSVGASGAIMGVLGAMGAFFWVQRRLLGAAGRLQLWNALVIFGLNVVLGLAQNEVIDNSAHIVGFLGGLALGRVLVPQYRPGRRLQPGERLLEDSTPAWAPPLIVIAALGLELIVFALALAAQKGAL